MSLVTRREQRTERCRAAARTGGWLNYIGRRRRRAKHPQHQHSLDPPGCSVTLAELKQFAHQKNVESVHPFIVLLFSVKNLLRGVFK